jgi:LysM repeat protein
MSRTILAVPLSIAAVFALSVPVMAQSRCGDAETVRAGETLEGIAQRCGVSLDALIEANPGIAGQAVEAGAVLAMPDVGDALAEETGDWLGRARQAVRDAASGVEDAATRAGRSVSDYLSEQPDLNRDILDFGERLGLPGVSASPEQGAVIEVVPAAAAPGEEVTLAARGLPGSVEVAVGAMVAGEFVRLAVGTTDPAGQLEVSVTVPKVPEAVEAIRFTVRTADERLSLTSEPFPIQDRT